MSNIVSLLTCLAASASLCSAAFYVSPQGNDANPGTRELPFATPQRVQTAIREARKAAPTQPAEAIFAPGRYQLSQTIVFGPEDSGTLEAPVVWRAEVPRQTHFTGSSEIPATAFKPVTDPAVLKRLDTAAAPHIRVADLAALGLKNLPFFKCASNWGALTFVPELFFNDTRMTLSRWPDTGWENIVRIVDSGSKAASGLPQANPEQEKKDPPRGGTFEYAGDRPARWDVSKGVFLHGYWCFDWAEQAIRVGSIDTEKHEITLAWQHSYGLRQGNPSPRRWYAFNILEELTAPGEFFLDYEHKLLYFYPPSPLESGHLRLTTFRSDLIQLANAHDITFRNMVFEDSNAGFYANNCDRIAIEGCEIRNMHSGAIGINNGSHCTIHSCDIHDTGTGGIALMGGNRKELIPQHHLIENCHIWNFSCHKLCYSSGITFGGIGNVARHNLLHDAVHMAVSLGANNNIFEYNVIHHACTVADDAGALYKGRNPSLRGNIIRYNLWHSIGKPMGHGNAAIYFDDGDVGETVFGNIFFRCGEPGKGSFGTVFCHGGHGHTCDNNIFIECKRPLGSAPWPDKRWKDMIDGSLWQTRLLKEVNITQPPYTTQYPDFVGFMDPQPGAPRISWAHRNLLLMCADTKSGNWQFDESNLVTDKDPGFVDLAHGNFNFKPDAEIFKLIPGFEPIPVDKIGLYDCPLRPSAVKEPWTLPPPHPLPPLKKLAPPLPQLPPKANPPVLQIHRKGTAPEATIDLGATYNGFKVPVNRCGKARLSYDDTTLYIDVEAKVEPKAVFNGNSWGKNDAVEIGIKTNDAKDMLYVIRGFANGFLYYGMAANGAADPLNAEPSPIVFKAARPAPDTWTASFAIPLSKLDLAANTLHICPFNITIRNPIDDLWIMWEPTHSNSYNAPQAGRLDWK